MHKHGKYLAAMAMTLGSVACGTAFAADESAAAPAAPTAPALSDVLTASGLTVNGYIAASYYHSSGYPSTNEFNSNIHQFDVNHDSFQLDQAGIQVGYQPKQGFGGYVDLIAGDDAKILHYAEDGNTTSFDVRQAYLQYAGGAFTFMAGKFVTLAGAEVINPTLNTNYSRSLLFFFSEPLTHTGIRASYALGDTLTFTAGLNNGWNTTSTNYGSKTGELAVSWIPNKMFSIASAAYFGKVPSSFVGVDAEKTLIDVVATWNVTSSLTLILNFDWDNLKPSDDSGSATWNGAALYANYAVNDMFRVSLRGEYLDDKQGAATGYGYGQTMKEVTLTFGLAPVKSFEARFEVRYDKAQSDPFGNQYFLRSLNGGEENGPTFSNDLTGIALQGVYKF
jgi:Putative beta-barrel porin-2, OmpL-like. bbp2